MGPELERAAGGQRKGKIDKSDGCRDGIKYSRGCRITGEELREGKGADISRAECGCKRKAEGGREPVLEGSCCDMRFGSRVVGVKDEERRWVFRSGGRPKGGARVGRGGRKGYMRREGGHGGWERDALRVDDV
jgi:hypothetical protein